MKLEEYEFAVTKLFCGNFFVFVPMTTVMDLDFSIHGAQWHQRDMA